LNFFSNKAAFFGESMGKTTDALANGLKNVQINWFDQFQDYLAVVSVNIYKNGREV
jgi:hypothetical protein